MNQATSSPASTERLYDVLRLVRPLHQAAARAVAMSSPARITVALRAVMEILHDEDGATVPQIARRLDVTRQGVQRVVDEGKQLGLLVSVGNPSHQRSHLIRLSSDGREAFRRLHAAELERMRPIAQGLADDQVQAAVVVLSTLLDGLTQLEPSSGEVTASTTQGAP